MGNSREFSGGNFRLPALNPFSFPQKFRQILGQHGKISILTSFALVSSIWSCTQFRQFLGQHPFLPKLTNFDLAKQKTKNSLEIRGIWTPSVSRKKNRQILGQHETWKNLNIDYFRSNIRGIWTPLGLGISHYIYISREWEFPKFSGKFSRISREIQIYYITNQNHPIFERKCIFLVNYNDFQLGYIIFNSKVRF